MKCCRLSGIFLQGWRRVLRMSSYCILENNDSIFLRSVVTFLRGAIHTLMFWQRKVFTHVSKILSTDCFLGSHFRWT
jgi:hypothetical protein